MFNFDKNSDYYIETRYLRSEVIESLLKNLLNDRGFVWSLRSLKWGNQNIVSSPYLAIRNKDGYWYMYQVDAVSDINNHVEISWNDDAGEFTLSNERSKAPDPVEAEEEISEKDRMYEYFKLPMSEWKKRF